MASHPYISGAGNITQMVGFLRKNFPPTVSAETVRKLGLASKNESYVINVLQFLRLIDEDGKRTDVGHKVMTTHNEDDFRKAFGGLIREAYEDLFAIRGDDAWTMSRDDLISYFRSADKTSEIIGSRQAGVFMALSELAGHEAQPSTGNSKSKSASTASTKKAAKKPAPVVQAAAPTAKGGGDAVSMKAKSDMALTVRIEINLPAEGSKETYDAIFKSIKANLFP
jgi:Family of unknown function (DUF5343)